MVLSEREQHTLAKKRCPVYAERAAGSLSAAEAALERLLFERQEEHIRRIRFSLFCLLPEKETADTAQLFEKTAWEQTAPSCIEDLRAEMEAGGVCFYDSEFGMYNYGDRQGDVVQIGAVAVPAQKRGSIERKEADETKAETAEAGPETGPKTELGSTIEAEAAPQLPSFSALVRNTEEEQLAERFQAFTGLSGEEIQAAAPFPGVFAQFCAFVRTHGIHTVYCLGSNDIERLGYMLDRYEITDAESRSVLLRFCNFQKWLTVYDRRLSAFSLESLTSLCGAANRQAHDALSDAETLYQVWRCLLTREISDQEIAAEQEAAHQRSRYKKSRRISFERMPVPEAVLRLKEQLLSELRSRNEGERYVPAAALRAICDDLDALLVTEKTEGEKQRPK